MWLGEQAPPPLPPPVGKGYDFPAGNPFDWKSRGLRPSRALPGRGGDGFPPHTTLSQIPLKSFGFPGAESARKRFFLRGQAPTPKKSAPGGDQPKSSISLGRSRSDLLAPWAGNLSAAQVAGLDWKSRGLRPSRALPEYSDEDFGSRRCGAWGALLPYTPSGTGCERVHTLSRSPGAVRSEVLVSDGTGGR